MAGGAKVSASANSGLAGALAFWAANRAVPEMMAEGATRRALAFRPKRRSYALGMKSPRVEIERPRPAALTPVPVRIVSE